MTNTITKQDYEQIHNLALSAFSSAEHSDGDEHNLIDRLRNTPEYILSKFGIFPPFEVPDEYFMVTQLNKDSIIPSGIVEYSPAFNL